MMDAIRPLHAYVRGVYAADGAGRS